MASPAPFSDQTDLDFSGLVRYVRVELGLTQPEFGALLGVCYETVSAWENDRTPTPLYKQRLIEGLAIAIEHGGVKDLPRTLARYGPAFALWFVLDKAYRA